jgi:hypothetical protein
MVLTSERVEKRPGVTLAAFLPPIFAGTVSVYMFHVSPLPPDHYCRGGLYIGVFRLSFASRDKDGRHRRSDAQTSMGGVAWLGACTTYAQMGLVASLVDFLCSRCFSW